MSWVLPHSRFALIAHVMLTKTGLCRGCSALFSTVTGIQKLDLSDTVVRDDGMQAVAQLSNLNNLNLAYSGTFATICKLRLSAARVVSAH